VVALRVSRRPARRDPRLVNFLGDTLDEVLNPTSSGR
jgi:hypothetical protein